MPTMPVPSPETIKPWEPTEAQSKLPTIKLFVGTVELAAEQCQTERQIQTGMMFRKTMTDDDAMLFVHRKPSARSYWMKNVSVPLSIGFIDASGRLLEIHDMEPFRTNGVCRELQWRVTRNGVQGYYCVLCMQQSTAHKKEIGGKKKERNQ